MQTEYLIRVEEFCSSHNIEVSFVSSLQETGLVRLTRIKEAEFIDQSQLPQLEQIVRFYYELDINLEGIEMITHMLQRINDMQLELTRLRNKVQFYEQSDPVFGFLLEQEEE